jgi:hypothetical protein
MIRAGSCVTGMSWQSREYSQYSICPLHIPPHAINILRHAQIYNHLEVTPTLYETNVSFRWVIAEPNEIEVMNVTSTDQSLL